jgi:hypothetical protein
MTWLSRCLCALVLVALLLAVATARPAWFRAVGVDLGGLSEGLWTLHEEAGRKERLEVERVATLQRIAEKDQLALDLSAGRLTLPEAVRRFRDLLRRAPPTWRLGIDREEGNSEDERLARHLLRRAANLQAGKSEAAGRAADRPKPGLETAVPPQPGAPQRLRAD